LRRQKICWLRLASFETRSHGVDLQLHFGHLPIHHDLHTFGEIAIDPRTRNIAAQCRLDIHEHGLLFRGHAVGELSFEVALPCTGEILHDADLAHGHEVRSQTPRLGGGHRQVVDADYSLGVWELAGGLCSLLCRNDGGSLGSHLQGLIARKL